MDADGPEGVWLSELDTLITAGKLRVGGLVVEGSNLDPVAMQLFLGAATSSEAPMTWGDPQSPIWAAAGQYSL